MENTARETRAQGWVTRVVILGSLCHGYLANLAGRYMRFPAMKLWLAVAKPRGLVCKRGNLWPSLLHFDHNIQFSRCNSQDLLAVEAHLR